MTFDLAIIGAGPGGYVAAQRAAAQGLKTVLFEERELGGVCLNEGCIPTKTLLYSAKLYEYASGSEKYGVSVEGASLDFSKVMARKDKVTKKLTGAIRVSMRNLGVEVVKARARILGGCDGDFRLEAAGQEYSAGKILLCTGSSTFIPPIPGLELGGPVITSREALSLDKAPQDLVIIGGGVIGMEFASFFNSIGTRVTVIEMLPEILGALDEEISAMLRAAYAAKGIVFHLGCKVNAVEGNTVVFITPEGEEQRVSAEKILVSVGRRANTAGLGLETVGVEVSRGIKTDAHMRTNVPGIYAAGDVNGVSMLAHTASREGEVAVNHILGIPDEMSYKAIPGVVYTNPEVAGVGLTESEALKAGLDIKVLKLPMAYSGRWVAENERGSGLCKLVCDKTSGQVLGVHMMGNPVSEIISAACLAVERGMSAEDLRRTIFPHPSVSEILKETAWSEIG
ncbi:MAG: dihydrolipoyl dehydrogenase [Candidatus Cryptobacteroides sp.]